MKQQVPSIEQQRDYLRRQRQGYELMEAQRRADLARLDYDQNLPMLNSLLEIGYTFRRPQPSSGLIAWQQLMNMLENTRRTRSSTH